MTKIKAIETRYDGYRFRSRLEARWAVFFNACGIKYEYEIEGFNLPSGKYLPDFWLPELKTWVEIKGGLPNLKELKLGSELFKHTGFHFFIATGLPCEIQNYGVHNDVEIEFPVLFYISDDTEFSGSAGVQWVSCPYCEMIQLGKFVFDCDDHEIIENFIKIFNGKYCSCFKNCKDMIIISYKNSIPHKASLKAKQARFEHGETPK